MTSYLKWNNELLKHFFNTKNEKKEVVLYISENIIEEIGKENFVQPEDSTYYEDFLNAMRIGVPGTRQKNIVEKISYLNEQHKKKSLKINGEYLIYPSYFSYLLLFILPFSSNKFDGSFSLSNFHDIVKEFFELNKLSSNYKKEIKNNLKDIDFIWDKLYNWLAIKENFRLGYIERIDHPIENRKYVSKFEYHILLRKEQADKLPKLFDKKNILPNEEIDKEYLREIIVNNNEILRLSKNAIESIKTVNDYIGEKILNRIFNYYLGWDGSDELNDANRRFITSSLILCAKYNVILSQVNIKYFRALLNSPLENNLIVFNNKNENFEISQENEFYSTPIDENINLNKDYIFINNELKTKFIWKTKNIIILKNINNFDWVEISKIEHNVDRTILIVNNDFFTNKIAEWYENIPIENKKELKLEGNNTQYSAYSVSNISKHPHPNISSLQVNNELKPIINFDREFYYEGKFFKNILPKLWVENIEIEEENILIARYEDSYKEIELIKLKENNFYIFTDEHNEHLNSKFKLQLIQKGKIEIETHRYYEISEFNQISSNEIETNLPQRNNFGQTSDDLKNYYKGIEPFFEPSVIEGVNSLQNIFLNFQNEYNSTHNYSDPTKFKYIHYGNLLLFYLSEKGSLSKTDFTNCILYLLDRLEFNGNRTKQKDIVFYSLQDLGYIDYDSLSSKIIINKPTLVPTNVPNDFKLNLIGARSNRFLKSVFNYCNEKDIEIEYHDYENQLLPQIIIINFKNDDIIGELLNYFNNEIIYKKYNLYPQIALTNKANDISEWENKIKEISNELDDFEGGEIFDLNTLKFIPKLEDFDKSLSFIKFSNINGYKTEYRLWYESKVYKILDQQIGIYIYLYLNSKVLREKLEIAKQDNDYTLKYDLQEKIKKMNKLTKVLYYNRQESTLAVPIYCRLPKFFSVATTMFSGTPPKVKKLDNIDRYDGYYLVYENIPYLFFSNYLISNLKQPQL